MQVHWDGANAESHDWCPPCAIMAAVVRQRGLLPDDAPVQRRIGVALIQSSTSRQVVRFRAEPVLIRGWHPKRLRASTGADRIFQQPLESRHQSIPSSGPAQSCSLQLLPLRHKQPPLACFLKMTLEGALSLTAVVWLSDWHNEAPFVASYEQNSTHIRVDRTVPQSLVFRALQPAVPLRTFDNSGYRSM